MTIVRGDGMHSTTNLALTGFSLLVTPIVISSSFNWEFDVLSPNDDLKICPRH